MPVVTPYVPQQITVHLGPPSADAPNVTVPFTDYVKNVASSEIYPTWEESALRANILAIVSFALNRVYTEFYRSRGYDFDITNSTAYDQAFVNGRSFFDNISRIVDDLFNNYLRRPGFVEPLAAKFCNGTTVTCEGLSQWGSQNLALQGYTSPQIIRSYYGNVEIVPNAPIRGITSSYPGTPLRVGSTGPNVVVVQASLNRIAQNYPAIPKIATVDGIFGSRTEASVTAFQRIFNLVPDGIVGRETWYALVRLYTGVTALSELRSQGQQFYAIDWAPPSSLREGSTGDKVRQLQYMLSVLSNFIPSIPPLTIDGIYGRATTAAVLAAQRRFRLPETGTVDATTWDEIYDQFAGIESTALQSTENFPVQVPPASGGAVRAGNFGMRAIGSGNGSSGSDPIRYNSTTTMTQFPGRDLAYGSRDPVSQANSSIGNPVRSLQTMLRVISEDDGSLPTVVPDGIYGKETMTAVSAFQRRYGLPVTGVTDQPTWEKIVSVYLPAMTRIGKAQPIEIIMEPGQIYRRGDVSPYLYLLQSMLLVLSQEHPAIEEPSHSGTLDAQTATALAAFQILAGLPPTGELDRVTWQYLVHQFTLQANRIANR